MFHLALRECRELSEMQLGQSAALSSAQDAAARERERCRELSDMSARESERAGKADKDNRALLARVRHLQALLRLC